MPRTNRAIAMPFDEIGAYHCFNRCVQQMTLCGQDPLSGEDRSSRKIWIGEMLEDFAASFAIDMMSYSLMDNHYHIILRNRPDLVIGYDEVEVAKRWWRICPGIRGKDQRAAEPDLRDLRIWIDDPDVIGELRFRLTSISWMMQLFNARVARRANAESGRKGHFFEGRFRSKRLLDEASIIACSLYVDMNPIRAEMATTPEQSPFTSANDRIVGRCERLARALRLGCTGETIASLNGLSLDFLAGDPNSADAFLSPLTLEAEKRLKLHLENSFPETGPIAWQTMEELRKNAACTCDESLRCLEHLLKNERGVSTPRVSDPDSLDALHAGQMEGQMDDNTTLVGDCDRATVGESPEKPFHESPTRIIMRPRPLNEIQRNSVCVPSNVENRAADDVPLSPDQSVKTSTEIYGETKGEFIELDELETKAIDIGDGNQTNSDVVREATESKEPKLSRKRVKVPKIKIPSKPRKSGAREASLDPAKRAPRRENGVHWLDVRGEGALRSDPDDLSSRLAFPSTRASNKGFMSMTLNEYLELLDWTGRRLVPEKQGTIPATEPPILARLGIKADGFIALIRDMSEIGGIAIGNAAAMEAEARRVGRKWLRNSHRMDDVSY